MQFDRNNTVVLDIQCHLDNNREYVIKELTYAVCDKKSPPVHTVFMPPYDIFDLDMEIVLQNDYIRNSIHGLFWRDGNVPYHQLTDVLQQLKDFTILVKGNEKLKCIKKYLPNTSVVDLVSMKALSGCKTPDLITSCGYHSVERHNRCSWIHVHKILYCLENDNLLV